MGARVGPRPRTHYYRSFIPQPVTHVIRWTDRIAWTKVKETPGTLPRHPRRRGVQSSASPDLTPEPAPASRPSGGCFGRGTHGLWPGAWTPTRTALVIVAVVVFVLILVAGYMLSRPSKNNSTGNSTGTSQPTATTAAGVRRRNPGQQGQAVLITGTTDSFTRADNPTQLGGLPNGSKWTVQTGGWGISNDSAYLSVPDTAHRNVAWVGTGYPAGQVQVKIATMEPGAGIVFRYSGPCSFWSVESAPAVASWNIFKVEEVQGHRRKATPATTVGLRRHDRRHLDRRLDHGGGQRQDRLHRCRTRTWRGAGKVGMIVSGKDSSKVRFAEFVAGGVKGQGIVKPTKKAGTTTTPRVRYPEHATCGNHTHHHEVTSWL